MKKRMETVEINTNGDSVSITQPIFGMDDAVVTIPKDQIDILIQWLQ